MSRPLTDPEDPRHGTPNGYGNCGCRCQKCRDAHAEDFRKRRADREARLAADPDLTRHGVPSTYGNWRCRCEACTAAWAADSLARKRLRKARKTNVKWGGLKWPFRTANGVTISNVR